MKQILRRLCLRRRYRQLVASGRKAMTDYLRAIEALELPFAHAEQMLPCLTARHAHARRCFLRARRIRRRFGIL